MHRFIILVLAFLPGLLVAQDKTRKNSFFIGTSQGLSFVTKEAFSNTTNKTFNMGPGYAYKLEAGLSIPTKSGKYLSEISLGYRSCSSSIDLIDSRIIAEGKPRKSSHERTNFLEAKYAFSYYVKTIKDYKTFFSAGIQLSYILNQNTKVNYFDGSTTVKKKASQISGNYVLTSSPTFILSYGVDLDHNIFGNSRGSRLSLDFTYDYAALGLMSSPTNQYLGTYINYRIMF